VRSLRGNVKRFRGRLVFKAYRLVYHSTLGWGVIKKKKSLSGRSSFYGTARCPMQARINPKGPKKARVRDRPGAVGVCHTCYCVSSSLLLSRLELSDTQVYQP